MSKSTLCNWCEKLGLCYKQRKKIKVHQAFDVDVVPPACNFIGNEALAHVFSCEFLEFLHPVTLLKTRPCHSYFLVILRNISVSNFLKAETPPQVFLPSFEKFFLL